MTVFEWTEVVRVGMGDLHIHRVLVGGEWKIQSGRLIVHHTRDKQSTVPLSAEVVKDAGHVDDRAPTS